MKRFLSKLKPKFTHAVTWSRFLKFILAFNLIIELSTEYLDTKYFLHLFYFKLLTFYIVINIIVVVFYCRDSLFLSLFVHIRYFCLFVYLSNVRLSISLFVNYTAPMASLSLFRRPTAVSTML